MDQVALDKIRQLASEEVDLVPDPNHVIDTLGDQVAELTKTIAFQAGSLRAVRDENAKLRTTIGILGEEISTLQDLLAASTAEPPESADDEDPDPSEV